jgi:D-threo-aldose 1-dehydrogenase
MPTWNTRQVGRTNLRVTEFGLGTATLAGRRFNIDQATGQAIVRAAWDAGIRYVDTAPFYGVGAAEHRVGDALRTEDRDSWVLSTKVGRLLKPHAGAKHTEDGGLSQFPFDVVYDYTYDGIFRSVEDSYQRLGLAKIDILFVHDIGEYTHGAEANAHYMKQLRDSGSKALQELKRTGVCSAFGLGVNEKAVILDVMQWGEWDVFLLAGRYTLLEQGPLDDLLPLCEQRGSSIVVGGPLNSGILAGRDTWNYAPAPADVVERVKRIQAVCDTHNVPLPAAAMRFPLAHPAVCAIIPGPRDATEFNANVPLFTHPIPGALWSDLKSAGLLRQDAPVPQ